MLEAQISQLQTEHEAQISRLETEHAEERARLQEQVQAQRSLACEMQDELRYYEDALEQAREEQPVLERESANAPNFMAAMQAKGELTREQRARAKLQEQLKEANVRIEKMIGGDTYAGRKLSE